MQAENVALLLQHLPLPGNHAYTALFKCFLLLNTANTSKFNGKLLSFDLTRNVLVKGLVEINEVLSGRPCVRL